MRGSPPDGHPLRVAHISLTLNTGGQERLLVDFARHCDRSRVTPEFIAMQEVGQPARDIEAAGSRVHCLKLHQLGRWGRIQCLRDLLRQREIDILHTHNSAPHVYGTIAARSLNIPIVHTRHGRRFNGFRSERWQFRLMSRFVDRVVAVSEDTRRLCEQVGNLQDQHLTRIWNGIDEQQFPFRGPGDNPIAITIGRLAPEKGLGDLIRAARGIKNEIDSFQLLVIGDGPERSSLERQARQLDLADCVQFLGERTDIADQLARASIYVCSSYTEGLSLAVLEAMAVGLPVIATDVGGNPEIVEHRLTGVLVPPGDSKSLSDAAIGLIQSPDTREEMSVLGRSRVEQHFGIRQMVQNYETLYRDILDRGKVHR